jgi:fibronectin-binding autotransporter adhesin
MDFRATAHLRTALKSSASFHWSMATASAMGLLLAAPLIAAPAFAGPVGGVVTTGAASISSPTSRQTNVDQGSEDVVIDWSSFNIGAGQTTEFVQPNAQAIAVNRIGGGAPSQIMGTLDANGRVVLIDGNGMVFGKGSQVNAGALVATTTGGTDSDVLAGKFTKAGNQSAAIVNEGRISASRGGLVALVAPHVSNSGAISARLGTVALGGASAFTVDFTGDGLVSFAAQGSGPASVANTGRLAGASVSLTARAAEGVATGVVNMGGMIMAQGAHQQGGTIVLDAGDGGDVVVSNANLNASGSASGGGIRIGGWNQNSVTVDRSSVIDASATNAGNGGTISVIASNTSFQGQALARGGRLSGNGGTIETSGHMLDFGGASVDASSAHGADGQWLLDPYDLTVDSTAAATIDSTLNSGTGVTLQTTATGASGPGKKNAAGNGDIFIDSPIAWSTTATLTLSAYRNIDFNASVTASGGGSVSMTTGTGTTGDYGFGLGPTGFAGSLSFTGGSTSDSTLSINGTAYALLYSMSDVQNINNGYYALAKSLNASGTTYANAVANVSGGVFAGLGNIISDLTINAPGPLLDVGLFGTVSNATVRDIGVVGGSVDSPGPVGGLVGYLSNGSISNSYATDAVKGGGQVGGLVGYSDRGSISSSYATGAVSGAYYVGGLVGELGFFSGSGDSITNSYATGAVSSDASDVGGLVGYSTGRIGNSYASGTVTITGNGNSAGGLVGDNDPTGIIENSYAFGAVFAGPGTSTVGGLVGYNYEGAISNSYATGAVQSISPINPINGPFDLGGLLGDNDGGTIDASYWATDTSGQATGIGSDNNNQSGNVGGKTIAQLQGALPTGFSSSVWGTGSGLLPYLLWQAPSGTPQTVSGFIYNLSGSAMPGQPSFVSANGTNNTLSSLESGVNGYFYDLVAPGTIANSGSQVLVYFGGAGGAVLQQNATGSITGLNVTSGYLTLATASTSYASASSAFFTNLATAIGDNSAAQTAVNSIGLAVVASGSSFTIDTPVALSQSLLVKTTAANSNITISDPVTLSGTNRLTLDASGAISQSSSGTITAATLAGSSSGAVTLTAKNDIANLGAFSTGNGAFSLTDSEALDVDGAVNIGTGTLTLNTAGAITSDSSGVIRASTLTGSSVGATLLTADNAIANLGAFSTGNGAFSLTDKASLTVDGAVNAGTGNVTLATTGSSSNLTIDAALTGAMVTLNSTGTIGGNSAGVITASTLTGSSSGPTSLAANNSFADLGAFATGSGTSSLTDVKSLTVNGAINSGAGNIVLQTTGAGHNIVVDAALSGYVVDLYSTGSITVDSALSLPGTGLGLFATGALYIDAPITVSNTGGVVLQAGYDTTTVSGKSLLELYFGSLGNISFGSLDEGGSLEINGTIYTLIYNAAEVQQDLGSTGVLSGDYALATSVDASSTTGWVPVGTNGSGGILNSGAGFSGIFEGLGNAVLNLTVNIGSSNYAGLFGYSTGTIRDITVLGGSVTGGKYVGGLVGFQSGGVISNVAVMVPVTGNSDVGGIVGDNTGAVTESFATGAITGAVGGGLVGLNSGSLVDDYASGAINASGQGGGLVGSNSGTIAEAYSTGAVSDASGGLVGTESGGTITDAYWDTQTSGASSSAGGTGLTTAQLQGALPTGFSTAVWGTGAGLFPYLLRQFPTGVPDTVSGTAYTSQGGTAAVGETLTILEDGAPLASITTGANGSYSAFLAPGGDAVIYGPGTTGASIVENVSGTVAGLPIYGNTLNEMTSDTLYSSVNSALVLAIGPNIAIENMVNQLGTLRIDTSASNFTIDEAINWPTVDLVAAGSINGGGITATTFMGSANGAVTLSSVTATNLGGFTTNNGPLSLLISGGTEGNTVINVTGAVDTGTGSLTLSGFSNVLNINAPLTGGTVSLNETGSIVQNSAGIITASTLTGSAGGSVPAESEALTANNAIVDLGAFIAEGGFSLDDATALTITGAINAGTGNLTLTTTGTGHGLSIDGTLTGATVDLASSSTIIQSKAGIITATTLTGSSNGAVALTADNAITNLGSFATNGGSLSITEAESLTVNTPFDVGTGNLTLTTSGTGSNLTIDAVLTGETVDLVSSGTISQNSTGVIKAATLSGSSNGAVTLTAANVIHNLGAFATSNGSLSLTDANSLIVNGAVNTGIGNLTLTTTGTNDNLKIDAAIGDAGHTLTLNSSGTIASDSAGILTARTLTGSSVGVTTLNAANAIGDLGAFTSSGGFALKDAKSLTVTGAVNAGTGNLTLTTMGSGSNLSIANTLSSSGTLDLVSVGTLDESGSGMIDASSLTGSSVGATTLNAANAIGDLGAFTTGNGAFSLSDADLLTVTGAVNAGTGNLTLTTTGAKHNLTIDKALTGATINLVSAGAIASGSAGILTAGTLTGSSVGATILNGANAIIDLGAFTNTGGNFVLTDDHDLTIAGTLNAGKYGVTLVDTGTLGESTGAIDAATLKGSSAGGATLNGVNLIGRLLAFTNTGAGGFALTDGKALTVTGAVNAGTDILSLTTTSGNLAIASTGILDANTVTLTAAAKATEATAGQIDTALINVTADTGIDLIGNNDITTVGTDQTNSGPNTIVKN